MLPAPISYLQASSPTGAGADWEGIALRGPRSSLKLLQQGLDVSELTSHSARTPHGIRALFSLLPVHCACCLPNMGYR